jgi:hypothetical protein
MLGTASNTMSTGNGKLIASSFDMVQAILRAHQDNLRQLN